MNKFSRFVDTAMNPPGDLPLCHTCDGYSFRDIAEQSTLNPTPCNVFTGENLLYFFYGRPAYRTTREQNALIHPAFMPVVILLKPDSLKSITRIAPFDTGAFENKKFDEHLHSKMKKEDFLLDPKLLMANKLISKFYSDNSSYVEEKPIALTIDPMDFEAFSYYSIITSVIKSPSDDRNCTIEIQSDNAVVIDESNVMLVILPISFMNSAEIRQTLSKWKVRFETYTTHRGNPNEYLALIYERVAEFMKAEGLL
jgi:hypothetical protein